MVPSGVTGMSARTLPISRWIDFGVLVFVNLLWAAQYPAYQTATDSMDVASLALWTLTASIVIFLPFLYLEHKKRQKIPGTRKLGRSLLDFLLLGLLGVVPPSVVLAWGIARSTASNASILALTIPVLMTCMAVVLLGERFTRIRVIVLVVSLLGTMLMSVEDLRHGSFGRELLIGNIAIFLSGLGSAFLNTYSKNVLTRFSELELLTYSYVVAIVACGIFSAVAEPHPFYHVVGYPLKAWVSVFVLGGLSWGLAMVLWMWVLGRLDVGQVSVSIYLLPFFGLGLSMITLHQKVSLTQLIGGVLVLIGTVVLTVYEKPPEKTELQKV
jgi:drug/metabolite transporter (DMT)-like permease